MMTSLFNSPVSQISLFTPKFLHDPEVKNKMPQADSLVDNFNPRPASFDSREAALDFNTFMEKSYLFAPHGWKFSGSALEYLFLAAD